MKPKVLMLKFLIGGSTVAFSYFVSCIIPWKDFGGIFATFPAVFLLSMVIAGFEFGDELASHVCRGAIFGMSGCLCSILVTWGMLSTTANWPLSIIVGFATWFISAVIISTIVAKVAVLVTHKSTAKHIAAHK
ncbi:DUF3147 family protein [Macrococcoides bohemicum]|uniref:DUF3147 family protein n=1 Tax=Macrococcoides bohemicum TaxID=1903056 RepID=A0A4R5XYG3_9STAP|nr:MULTISPECIES: DUF3147 family protein [Macrococcus]ATD31277.1 hypothetical protein BHM04_08805 [Macrococcus sp. IME1552]QRN48971.1 DUF3147 family protein [Macrococcus bohemicus]QYA42740.1 DUF3147 family protein [Macrococcus bohemicus]QYA45108.1 DUF3147 family protein [Macrococcus bohemicus]TDL36062.1 DUF3147 family protein [Macrococcus bohemicus]